MTLIQRLGILLLLLAAPAISTAQMQTSTIDRFSLILYAFDSDEPGPLNQRILDEYVFPEIRKQSEITIVGYSDVVGQEKHNYELADRRARRIAERIKRRFGSNGYRSLTAGAVGEEAAPYRHDLPEGRLLSRTVIITLKAEGERREWRETGRETEEQGR